MGSKWIPGAGLPRAAAGLGVGGEGQAGFRDLDLRSSVDSGALYSEEDSGGRDRVWRGVKSCAIDLLSRRCLLITKGGH